jgi:hypothetical protein
MAAHDSGINKLPRWDPNNPTKYNYDPSNYNPADYAQFKQARLAAQGKQPKTSFDQLSKRLSKGLQKSINEIIKEKVKEAPGPKTRKDGKYLQADTSGSVCFDNLVYSKADGGVYADFANPTVGTWFYPMSEAEARDWFENAPDLGAYFNAFIRSAE